MEFLLVLALLEVVFADQELCIPQGNKCKEDWQCCKGFHCESPIYKDEPHCIADHEQLMHRSGGGSGDGSGDGDTLETLEVSEEPPPPKPIQSPEQIMMMKLMEAALGQLSQGKPVRMKVNIKNPQVLLDKLPETMSPSRDAKLPSPPQDPYPDSQGKPDTFQSHWGEHTDTGDYEEEDIETNQASPPQEPESQGKPDTIQSPWGEHTHKGDDDAKGPKIKSKTSEEDKSDPIGPEIIELAKTNPDEALEKLKTYRDWWTRLGA